MSELATEAESLFETIKKLRSPEGCPWDREQTPLSLRGDLLEETFETLEAISENDANHAKEELGDVLLNALMIAYMYQQEGAFSVADCFKEVNEKIIRRHPHVFPQSEGQQCAENGGAKTSEEVLSQWERIKATVEGRKSKESILDEVSKGLSPLLRASKIQKKASKKGFDWDSWQDVLPKIQEELAEVVDAVSYNEKEQTDASFLHLEEEIGDLLFAVVNLSRLLKVNPEIALQRTTKKFRDRFYYIEKEMAKQGLDLSKENLDKMENLWNEAKKQS